MASPLLPLSNRVGNICAAKHKGVAVHACVRTGVGHKKMKEPAFVLLTATTASVCVYTSLRNAVILDCSS